MSVPANQNEPAVFADVDLARRLERAEGLADAADFAGCTGEWHRLAHHQLACAAGLATLEVFREQNLFERAHQLAPYWEDALHSLRSARHVIDVRNLGLIGGIELDPRPGKPIHRALDTFRTCFERGIFIRVTGDIIALSPPLIIEKTQIDQIVETIRDVLKAID